MIHMEEPAKSIIAYLGGVQVVASVVKKHPSRVYRWMYPATVREGAGGIIPARDQRRLLERARETGKDLRPEDFFSPDRLRALLLAHDAASPLTPAVDTESDRHGRHGNSSEEILR